MQQEKYRGFVFDLDGTLAESKSPMKQDISEFLGTLLKSGKTVGVISGGWMPQFEKQFLSHLHCPQELLSNLYLMPTSGATMYVWRNHEWEEQYSNKISEEEYKRILKMFDDVFVQTSFPRPDAKWGEQIEYRKTQVTFSAFGQKAPLAEKEVWDPNNVKKLEMVKLLIPLLPEYSVKAGGTTSVDITRKGIDKAYGIKKFFEVSGHNVNDTLFVGDALYEGGNDYAAVRTGVDTLAVLGPSDLLNKFKL